jgi:hypothetical protein
LLLDILIIAIFLGCHGTFGTVFKCSISELVPWKLRQEAALFVTDMGCRLVTLLMGMVE